MVVLKEGSRPPWVGLGAAVWVQIAAGNSFTFPLYSPSLKSIMGFNQLQLSILGVANDIGESFGLLPGLACNRWPPWAVLLVGVFLSFFGYGVLWLAVTRNLASPPYWLLWIALCIATNGSAWLGTTVLVTNMRNFPLSRGTVAGILKGYIGLSAAVFAEVYTMILHESASGLLLLLALGIPAVGFLMMYFVRPCTPSPHGGEEDSSENSHFLFVQGASLALAVYLLTTTMIKDLFPIGNALSYAFVSIMVALLLAPLAIPLKMTIFPRRKTAAENDDLLSAPMISESCSSPSSSAVQLGGGSSFYESEDVSEEVDMLIAVGEGAVKEKEKKKKKLPRRGDDFKFAEAIVKADFWLLWFVYFVGVGSGVTVLNNLAQIGVSLGVDNATILLSLFSFCNFLGRLGSGALSEHFVRCKMIPRTFWMAATQALMVLTFLLYASSLNGTLHAATGLLGICYGVQFGIMIPTASELFGLKHFGIIFNFIQLGNPVGATLFSVLLAGQVYDSEAAKQQQQQQLGCVGPSCFRLTFLVLAAVCGVGTVMAAVLTARIRPVYQSLYAGGSFRLP
ncbi:hypothetical protein M569_03631, partial [Genlisea aurea]